MQVLLDEMARLVVAYIPNLIRALAILLIGWLVAVVIAAIVRRVLWRTTHDDRLAPWILGLDDG